MILKVKNGKPTFDKIFINQPDAFENGRLTLGNAMKNHSGDYVLEEFQSNGSTLKKMMVHLEIQGMYSMKFTSYKWTSIHLHIIAALYERIFTCPLLTCIFS